MNRRSLIILVMALVTGAGLFAGSYLIALRLCARQTARATDDLDWLRQEFRLSEPEMKRVRELHEGYTPRCAEMCRLIATKKRELNLALTGTTNVTAAAEQKLRELGELRAQCQVQMLRHFVEVSQAMPPEQGLRYVAETRRLTLGFHEQIEQSMSQPEGHARGHH